MTTFLDELPKLELSPEEEKELIQAVANGLLKKTHPDWKIVIIDPTLPKGSNPPSVEEPTGSETREPGLAVPRHSLSGPTTENSSLWGNCLEKK